MSSRGIRGNTSGTSNIGGDVTVTPIGAEEKVGLDIVEHAHGGSGMIHYQKSGISVSEDAILIDSSDTINYPHNDAGAIHVAWFNFDIDPSIDAEYILQIGFLENVDATNGDFYEVFTVSGTRKAGNAKGGFFPMSPQGPQGSSAKIATSNKSLNDLAFQTDVNLASTLDPGAADTPSGDHDFVFRLTITAGSINLSIEIGYHSHQ